MYRICLNVAISFYRRESARTRHVLSDEDHLLNAIDETANQSEQIQMLYQFIEGLNPLNKALVLLYLDGNSYLEIADVLGISETNVATKISRLKQTMKQGLGGAELARRRKVIMLDLDEMKKQWAEHDRKLDESIRLNRQLLSTTKLNGARSAMQRMAGFLGLEAAVQLAVVVALGSFICEHIAMVRFALPAAALEVFAIAILIAMIRQIAVGLQIDYDKPIAVIQKQLEDLRVLRIRYIQGIFLAATLAWTPLMIVALEGFWGLDAYRLFGAAYMVSNLLVGLAILPLAFWLSKRFSDRMGRSPFIQRLMKDLAGYNLNAAAGFLTTLSQFEDENPAK
jgi:DNA-directed RNA polymerase specialized sigma24 family protein